LYSPFRKSDKRKKQNTILTDKQFAEYSRLLQAKHNLSEIATRLNYTNRWTLNYARKNYLKQKSAQTNKKIVALDEIREGKKSWKS
jgi:hypothetical protein